MAKRPKHRTNGIKPRTESATAAKEFCPERVSINLDDNSRLLINASKRTVDWPSITLAINAAVHQAFHRFTPEGVTLCVHPLEQAVFAKKLTVQQIIKKLTKRARK